MIIKLIPRLQDGGLMQRYPSLNNSQKLGSSLAEQALLKARNAQSPPMSPIQPIGLNESYANTVTGLGNKPFVNLDTKTLASNNVTNSTGLSAGGIGTIAQGVADIGIAGINAFSKSPESNEFGMIKPENNGSVIAKSTLKSAGSGAATGATIGSVVPGLGTAVGAVAGGLIGAVSGFFKGKKDTQTANQQYNHDYSANYGKFYGNQYANQFAAMKGKDGMKMKTAQVISNIGVSKSLVPRVGNKASENVIVSGKLHKENNNLGNKDKGIPVINNKGRKVFELEKEEWILNLDATRRAERLANDYINSNDDSILENLGREMHKELTTNTRDNSNKFELGD